MEQATSNIALIVEDDFWQRELVSVLLEESGIGVVQCDTAEEALGVLEQFGGGVGMIFTDVNLAGQVDGVELAHVAAKHYPHIHVTVTSGNELNRPLPQGATFLPKPWVALDVLQEAERSFHH
jgi:two-component system cell cycle response regulator CpdR